MSLEEGQGHLEGDLGALLEETIPEVKQRGLEVYRQADKPVQHARAPPHAVSVPSWPPLPAAWSSPAPGGPPGLSSGSASRDRSTLEVFRPLGRPTAKESDIAL